MGWKRSLLGVAATAAVTLVAAGCGGSSTTAPPLVVGAVDDAAKWAPNPARTMAQAHDSGFETIVLSAVWSRGTTAAHDLPPLRRAVRAAVAADVEPILAVYQLSSSTPDSDRERAAFAAYAAELARALPGVHEVIVGNEPNLNLFWAPQFGADGSDAAAGSYEALLATTYDALKALASPPNVIGGGLAPRGGDDSTASRQTHSPTAFIRDLGAAYRASGRKRPLMDCVLDPRLRREPTHPTVVRAPEHDVDRDRRLPASWSRCSAQPSTARRRPGPTCRSSTANTASRRTSRRTRRSSTPAARSCRLSTPATQAALLPPGDRAGTPPADGAHALFLPRRRRDAPRRPAERCAVRGRHAEAEPRGRSHDTARSLDFAA